MTTELRWLANHSTSCLHAAEVLYRGLTIVDATMTAAVLQPAQGLHQEMRAAKLPAARLWRHLLGLSPGIDNNKQLVELALRKTIGDQQGSGTLVSRLAAWVTELEDAVRHHLPQMSDELRLRGGPLRQQWEARGPGMMHRVAELTEDQVIVSSANVVLVHPALGGGGEAHLSYNSLRIEAVLANPLPELPEVVRIGWMLSQLNIDLPKFSESIHADRLPLIAQLAMLPIILRASEHVDLAECDRLTIELALKAWHVDTPLDFDAVDVLTTWWDTFNETRPAWPVALAALDRMFGK